MMLISSILTVFGLIFDIIGVVKLFNSISEGLKEIKNIQQPMFNNGFFGFGISSTEQQAIEDLKTEVNEIINSTNERNDKIHNESKKWLCLIIVGFLFQIVAILLSITIYFE